MIPLVLVLLDRGSPVACFWAAVVYALAAITDMVDGWLAQSGLVSVLGKFLDPLADKLIVAAVLVWLVGMGRMPAWAVVLLLSREILPRFGDRVIGRLGDRRGAGGNQDSLQFIGLICLILGYPYHYTLGIYDFGLVDFVHVGRVLIYISIVFHDERRHLHATVCKRHRSKECLASNG